METTVILKIERRVKWRRDGEISHSNSQGFGSARRQFCFAFFLLVYYCFFHFFFAYFYDFYTKNDSPLV